MDPLTAAAKAFMREVEAFATPAPGHAHTGPRALQLVSAKGERGTVVKTLRWLEYQPQNGRPVMVIDTPVESAVAFVSAIETTVRAEYAAILTGLCEDGVTLAPLPPATKTVDAQSLAALLDVAANHLAAVLDGLYVALVPAASQLTPSYRGVVMALARHVRSEALHVLAWDCAGALDGLGLARAALTIDEAALWAHLESLGEAPSKGPATSKPALTPQQRAQLAATGVQLPSGETTETLRKLLLRASRALQEKQPRVAIRNLRAARALCHLDGLRDQEAAILLGLGTTYLHGRNTQGARASYRTAAAIAEATGNTRVAEVARRALEQT